MLLLAIVLLSLAGGFFLLRRLYEQFWDKGLSCRLSFNEEYGVEDEESSLTEVVVNDKLLPMPAVEIDFHMDRRLLFSAQENSSVSDQTYRRDVFALGLRQKITRTLAFRCAGRGYFRIDRAGLTGWDLFLTRKYLSAAPQNTVFYVFPRPVPTEEIVIPYSRIMGSLLSRKKVYDDPFEFAGIREYSRGDPMKYVNWKATARTGQLLTNIHESTLSQRVTILLDMARYSALQADQLCEAGLRMACSLAERLLRSGVEVSILSNGQDVLTGETWRLDELAGEGSILAMKKKFSCLESREDAPVLWESAGQKELSPGEEPDLLVLISQNQREDFLQAFADLVGRGEGLMVLPYHNEHGEISLPGHIGHYWMGV